MQNSGRSTFRDTARHRLRFELLFAPLAVRQTPVALPLFRRPSAVTPPPSPPKPPFISLTNLFSAPRENETFTACRLLRSRPAPAATTSGSCSRVSSAYQPTGPYDFFTNSDEGSRLYIGNILVVDNDGLHPARERAGRIGLKAGLHTIRVEYFERTGAQSLTVSYDGPTFGKRAIPASALFQAANATPAGGLAEGEPVRLFPIRHRTT